MRGADSHTGRSADITAAHLGFDVPTDLDSPGEHQLSAHRKVLATLPNGRRLLQHMFTGGNGRLLPSGAAYVVRE